MMSLCASLLFSLQNGIRTEKHEIGSRIFFFIILLALLAALFYFLTEWRIRKKHQKNYAGDIGEKSTTKIGIRVFPRISIPMTVTAKVLISDSQGKKLDAKVLNISPAGFCIQCDSIWTDIQVNHTMENIVLQNAVNVFSIREMKIIWLLQQRDRIILGFQIQSLEPEQRMALDQFIFYLQEFQNHEKK